MGFCPYSSGACICDRGGTGDWSAMVDRSGQLCATWIGVRARDRARSGPGTNTRSRRGIKRLASSPDGWRARGSRPTVPTSAASSPCCISHGVRGNTWCTDWPRTGRSPPGSRSNMPTATIEPELNQSVPRRATPREGGCAYGCALWPIRLFILPHTLAGAYVIFMALSRIVLCLGVWLAGTDVDGRIVRKIETRGKKGPHYSAEYVYTFDRGEYTATVSMHADEWAATREGQTFNVRVLVPGPEGGHWPGVGNVSPLADVLGLCFIALFWNGILSVFLYHLYYRPWRHRWMVRRGHATQGIVREVQKWQNKGTNVRIKYEYAVLPGEIFGRVLTGSVTATGKEAEVMKVGDVVTVLYSPRRPRRSLLYALAMFKALPPRK